MILKGSFNKQNTIVIVGCSEYATSTLVNKLIENFTSIGINRACLDYNTNYVSTSETSFFKHIARIRKPAVIPYNEDYYKDNYDEKDFYYTQSNEINLNKLSNKLLYKENSLIPVVNWCILQGYSNILMVGISIDECWAHYYNKDMYRKQPKEYIEVVRNALYSLARHINIYACHNNSFDSRFIKTIDIDKITY
jgi:hypothetical protein